MAETIVLPRKGRVLFAAPNEDRRLLLNVVDWETYRKISDALSDCHVQVTYDRGTLELVTRSNPNKRLSRVYCQLVWVLTQEAGLEISTCGSMTCDREDLDCSLEPDESFYIANERIVRTREGIDLRVDPPPDLAIEIDPVRGKWTRLPIFGAIGVPEVWRFDGTSLVFHRLRDGAYLSVERSDVFPFLTPGMVLDAAARSVDEDDNSIIRRFRERIREAIRESK